MKIVALFVMFSFLAAQAIAQGHREDTENIRTVKEAVEYAQVFATVNTQFLSMDFERFFLGKELDTLKPGDLHTTSYYEVRTVAIIEKDIYRFNMISLFDAQKPDAATLVDSMLHKMKTGSSFQDVYKTFMPIPPVSERAPGDVGWIDIDIFEDPLNTAIRTAKLNDIFTVHDTVRGMHHLVWITHESKKASGPFVVFYPREHATELPMKGINHGDAVKRITDANALIDYAKKYQNELTLELVHRFSMPELFEEIQQIKKDQPANSAVVHDGDEKQYRYIKDTLVSLYSFQYIYLNGNRLTKGECKDAIHDIYKKFNDGVSFDEIISEYWPDNNGFSTLENVDGALLAPDFVAKLNDAKVGELFVARVSQSYFIGVTIDPKRTENAFLVLGIPH